MEPPWILNGLGPVPNVPKWFKNGRKFSCSDKSEMERDESWNEGVNTAANIKIYHITSIQNSKKIIFFNNNKAIPKTSLTFLSPKIIIFVQKCKFYILQYRIKWWMQIISQWADITEKVCVWPCLELDYMRWTNWLNVTMD